MTRQPWLGVELRHLTALAAVAREGSFRAAADSLGYVQSAVSEQIAALESSIGVSVLQRRRGTAPTAPTEAGALLLRHIDDILRILTVADGELEELRTGRRARMRVGVFESIAVRILPEILHELARTLPEVDVELVSSGTGDDLAELVEMGQLDVAFGSEPFTDGSFRYRELLRDPYVLMTPAGWPLALACEPPTVADLRGLPLIAGASGERAALAEAELRAHGIEPRYVLRSGSNGAVQALVGAGLGAALVPRLAADDADDRVALLELGALVTPRAISLFWRADNVRPALERFVEIAACCCVRAPEPVAHLTPVAA